MVGERISGYTAADNRGWDWEIDFFEVLRPGPPNRVRRGVGTGTNVAVVQKEACGSEESANRLRDEIDIGVTLLRRLREFGRGGDRYPSELSRLIGSNENGPNPFLLVTSLSPTARTFAESRRPLGLGELKQFAVGLFTGLYWLELADVVHRDLTPSNIVWDGGRIQIIDFSHAALAGAIREQVKAPPWDLLDDTTQPLVEPYDDLRRAGFLLIYAATTVRPEDLLPFYKNEWRRDPRYATVTDWLGTLLDDAASGSRRTRVEEVLKNLGVPLPVLPTQYDPRVAQGRDQFANLKRVKESRRSGRQAGPGQRGLPLPRFSGNIERYVYSAGVVVVAMLVLMLLVRGCS